MPKEEKKIPDFLAKLMEGFSTYTKASNQYWTALIFFCLVAIAPSINKDNVVEMPFNLGKFKTSDFYLLVFFVNAILVICFGSAFSQAIRARKLIQRAVDQLKKDYIFDGQVYLQDAVDVILYPALNRVAPLAQVWQGKSQFFPEAHELSRSKRLIAYGYYTAFLAGHLAFRFITVYFVWHLAGQLPRYLCG